MSLLALFFHRGDTRNPTITGTYGVFRPVFSKGDKLPPRTSIPCPLNSRFMRQSRCLTLLFSILILFVLLQAGPGAGLCAGPDGALRGKRRGLSDRPPGSCARSMCWKPCRAVPGIPTAAGCCTWTDRPAAPLYALMFDAEGKHWRTLLYSYGHPRYAQDNSNIEVPILLGPLVDRSPDRAHHGLKREQVAL